ncbi:MAG: hypothetical protein K6C12_02805 [Oscillospiraceae bacterium]|nr:hypothetical protein [Oscillospiraceae bacterium]
MKNLSNVEAFFKRYDEEPALRERVEVALANYPGSLEIRESVVEYVLLPVAEAEGLPFTVQELRAYETRKKLDNRKEDVPIEEDEPLEEQAEYWLLDRGWEWDDSRARKRDALLRDIEEGWTP